MRILVVLSVMLLALTGCTPQSVRIRIVDVKITATPSVNTTTAPNTPVSNVVDTPVPTEVIATVEPVFGESYYVANTDGEGVYIRLTRDMADRIVAWPDDTEMTELSAESEVDGTLWRNVRDPVGNEGYVPSQYLSVEPAATEAPVVAERPDVVCTTATVDYLTEIAIPMVTIGESGDAVIREIEALERGDGSYDSEAYKNNINGIIAASFLLLDLPAPASDPLAQKIDSEVRASVEVILGGNSLVKDAVSRRNKEDLQEGLGTIVLGLAAVEIAATEILDQCEAIINDS